MQDIIEKLPEWIQLAATIMASLTIVASVVVRLTPSAKDDEYSKLAGKWIFKVIKYLPTLGVNPDTKKLEEAYKKLKNDKDRSAS